jgi:hypothetical protein
LTLLLNARGHLVRITRRQPVLGIDHPQEAIGWNLSVDEHELCDPCAARLNNRNVAPEGCNFLCDGFDEAFNVPLTI